MLSSQPVFLSVFSGPCRRTTPFNRPRKPSCHRSVDTGSIFLRSCVHQGQKRWSNAPLLWAALGMRNLSFNSLHREVAVLKNLVSGIFASRTNHGHRGSGHVASWSVPECGLLCVSRWQRRRRGARGHLRGRGPWTQQPLL